MNLVEIMFTGENGYNQLQKKLETKRWAMSACLYQIDTVSNKYRPIALMAVSDAELQKFMKLMNFLKKNARVLEWSIIDEFKDGVSKGS